MCGRGGFLFVLASLLVCLQCFCVFVSCRDIAIGIVFFWFNIPVFCYLACINYLSLIFLCFFLLEEIGEVYRCFLFAPPGFLRIWQFTAEIFRF